MHFNTKKVRLKLHLSAFHGAPPFYFNTKKVRLKLHLEAEDDALQHLDFNTKKVRLKRRSVLVEVKCRSGISIPKRCD